MWIFSLALLALKLQAGFAIFLTIFIELDLITKGDMSAFDHVLVNQCTLQARSRQSH
jgi:hypothetical protein